MAAMVEDVAEAFRTGQGVPRERYPDRLFAAMERMSATWLDTMLVGQWLPAVDGLVGRLERGAKVADVGSGRGRALITMAKRFPGSEFVGYDLHAADVEQATRAAQTAGVADRVRFHAADATTGLTGPLDLVTMFDMLHDAPDPEALLAAVRRSLADDGVLLVLESGAAENAEDNAGPQAGILYATSTLYCVPTALAEGGPALGTLGLPHGELSALARRAGFGAVDEIPIQSPLNALYRLVPQ
jgi:SAM-dependent methyltransferase